MKNKSNIKQTKDGLVEKYTGRKIISPLDFTIDEIIVLRFLQICVPSLDPDSYQNVLDACNGLCLARSRLNKDSVTKCLRHIFGDDYKEPVIPCKNSFV